MKFLRQENIDTIVANCLKKSRKRKRNCFVFNCKNKTVNSHVLSQSVILKNISTNSLLMGLNAQKRKRNEKLKFVPTGLKETLAFNGFCKYHDNEVFKSIEYQDATFDNMKNQILVSVRGVYYEIRKKEIIVDWYKCMLKENVFPFTENEAYLKTQIYMNDLGIKDLKFITSELNKEYRNPKGRFVFKYYELEEIPIVASTIFHVDSFQTMEIDSLVNANWETDPLNAILFSFFPFKGKSIMIIGFHTNYLKNLEITHKIDLFSKKEFLKFISDILIERIESWACSFEFYETYIKPNENKILEDLEEFPNDFNGSLSDKINLFENWK